MSTIIIMPLRSEVVNGLVPTEKAQKSDQTLLAISHLAISQTQMIAINQEFFTAKKQVCNISTMRQLWRKIK